MLGVDPALDRHAWMRTSPARSTAGAGGDFDLFVDQVDAGHLGDGMLDLDAGGISLNRSRRFVGGSHRATPSRPTRPSPACKRRRISSRWAALSAGDGPSSHTLLMAALQRAVRASPRWIRAALYVAEHLELNVARFGEILLEIDGRRRTPSSLRASPPARASARSSAELGHPACRARRRPPPP